MARRILKEYPSASWLNVINENSAPKEVINAIKR